MEMKPNEGVGANYAALLVEQGRITEAKSLIS